MGHGDCVITLSLLSRLPPQAPAFEIIGTAATTRVSALLARPLPVTEVLPGMAALYTIRHEGWRKAAADFFTLRKALHARARPGDILAFERDLRRSRWLVPPRTILKFSPEHTSGYEDRRIWLQDLFGVPLDWPARTGSSASVRRVAINPCARTPDRQLPAAAMESVLACAKRHSWKLTLIDPQKAFAEYRSRVSEYRDGMMPLAQAADLLRGADLYIGPDSFFLHLAYYLGVSPFGIFLPDWLYFLLPGSRESHAYCDFDQARTPGGLERALERFLVGTTSSA
jgi:ADP-heptose:LPS heptosyltransferase